MSPAAPLLPWTTRGLRYETREYLAAVDLRLEEYVKNRPPYPEDQVNPNTPFTVAMRIYSRTGRPGPAGGPPVEYGSFDHDGTLIEDPGLRFRRQSRNILCNTIRDLFNLSRGFQADITGAPIDRDCVPDTPEGNWTLLLTEECPRRDEVAEALRPLVDLRKGRLEVLPKMNPGEFQQWLAQRYNSRSLPSGYILICDTFDNFPIEYQYLFNAFAVAGRLCLDRPEDYGEYARKVRSVADGTMKPGGPCVLASPLDDDVTFADGRNIIEPFLSAGGEASGFEPLVGDRFSESSLLDAARNSRMLALYTHGVALNADDWQRMPEMQGAFVLKYDSREDEGLLTADEVAEGPFVPGGVVFSPACFGGGNQADSDFIAWIDPEGLPEYAGARTGQSAAAAAMLRSPYGPAAAVLHFDISIASSAPMFNPLSGQPDLQRELHSRFLRNLAGGQTVGRATAPFRWAAGILYAQAIHIYGQLTGRLPYFGVHGGPKKTIGQFVNSMNQFHVAASDMRNYLIFGDPAVRVA